MRYFRVYTNFTEYIPIKEDELEKGLHAFITGKPVVFDMGSTSRIDRIVPDFNRTMGINPAWKFDVDDWNEAEKQGVTEAYKGIIGKVKDKIQYLMETNQSRLIGKNVEIPQLENKK